MVERAERVQLLERQHERLVRRRVHEVEVQQVVDAERLQQEDDVAEVRPLDLGHGVLLELVRVRPRRVEAEAGAGGDAAGAAGALAGGRARHRRHDQRLHAGARVVAVLLAEAGVDDVHDAVDRQRRLRDVRRQHHLAARARDACFTPADDAKRRVCYEFVR